MSGAVTVLKDMSLLSRIDGQLFRFESLLALLSGITIMMLVFLATFNIMGRWVFNIPISGYVDWVEQFMAVFAFLGIAYCQREGGHIRMDMVVGAFKGRTLWFTELVTVIFMFIISCLLTYGSYSHFLRAFVNGDSSIDIGLPTWPAKLMVPLALTLLSMRLLVQIWGFSRAIWQNSEQPVAVPLIEDAATAALREAKSIAGDEIIDDVKDSSKGDAQ